MESDFWGNLLGSHTLTLLGDRSAYDERRVPNVFNSFGDPEPALHITAANGRQTANNVRNVPNLVYIGPVQLDAFTDPNWKLSDFTLTPAKYDIIRPDGFEIQKMSWNLGPDASNDNIGLVTGPNSVINGNEDWVEGTFRVQEVPTKNIRKQRTKINSAAVNTQSMMFNDHLVLNLGYREDTIDNWLNTEPTLIGLDEIPDLTDKGWTLANGIYSQSKESTFGYGGVLYWPKRVIPLPEFVNDITFHYNTSDNFIPSPDRVDEFRKPVASPKGESQDWGVSFYLFDNKLTARLNWYKASLLNASSSVSNNYNQQITNIFNHFGNLNQQIMAYDANGDMQIDQEVYDELTAPDGGVFPFDPDTGLNDEGLTVDQLVAQLYPNLVAAHAARANIEPFLTPDLKAAFNYRMAPDGDSQTQWAGAITDTQDIESKGFEAELIYNPTRSWRIAFNAAQQQTILTNIAPRLTELVDTVWVPHLNQFGFLDWNAPVEELNGNTTQDQVGNRLIDYFAIKGNAGKPNPEQREWRFNLITNYTFRDGFLKGFSVGGAARWEDTYAAGYPIIVDPVSGLVLPDVANAYFAEKELSLDFTMGYRRKLFDRVDWRMQINVRNLQNLDNDKVNIIRYQPDGTAARARFAPPSQIWLTNTFTF